MEKKRFWEIDFLRAISIVGVVAIHTAAFNLKDPYAYLVWNYLQYVVVAFVFCSGYVLGNRYQIDFTSIQQIASWLKKRLIRLLIPFYLYLFIHYSLWIIFPGLFTGFGLSKSFPFIINSLFLTGGADLNWLPLLFTQLTLLFVFLNIIKKKTSYYFGFLLISILFSVYITFFDSLSQYYRWTMWIPWSLVLLTALKISSLEKESKFPEKRYVLLGSILFSLFIAFFVFWGISQHSLIFREHKYPPDLYYLSYSLGLTLFTIVLSKIKLLSSAILRKPFFYLSSNSYSLFFIHIVVLDFFFKNLRQYYLFSNWFFQFLTILFLSIFIKILFDKVNHWSKRHNSAKQPIQNYPKKNGFWNS